MSGVKLSYLPDSQLLRLKAMRNTCERMDDLIVSYYEKEGNLTRSSQGLPV